MEDSSKMSDLAGLSNFSKTFFGLFLFISYIVGSLGKKAIFEHMRNFRLSERPINVLILVDEIIYFTLITFTTFNLLIVLLVGQTPAHFIQHHLFLPVDEDVSITVK
jgi:hypothetical protein